MKRREFFKSLGGAIAALMLPFGVKVSLSVDSIPEGYLIGDGRAIQRSQYPELFNAIEEMLARSNFPLDKVLDFP